MPGVDATPGSLPIPIKAIKISPIILQTIGPIFPLIPVLIPSSPPD